MLTVYRVTVMSTEAASGSTNPAYNHTPMSNRVMSAIPVTVAALAQSGASIGMSKVSTTPPSARSRTSAPSM